MDETHGLHLPIGEVSGEQSRPLRNSDEAEMTKGSQRIEHILKSYAAGEPLFSRSLLEDLDRQLSLGKDCVHINDFDNIPQEYSLKAPLSHEDA
jgi:hypothetical protein